MSWSRYVPERSLASNSEFRRKRLKALDFTLFALAPLAEIDPAIQVRAQSAHQRYLVIFKLIEQRVHRLISTFYIQFASHSDTGRLRNSSTEMPSPPTRSVRFVLNAAANAAVPE
jgi:hypothetical protein